MTELRTPESDALARAGLPPAASASPRVTLVDQLASLAGADAAGGFDAPLRATQPPSGDPITAAGGSDTPLRGTQPSGGAPLDTQPSSEPRFGAPSLITAVLCLVTLAALVAVGLFWHTAAAWEADSAAWQAQAREQASGRAQSQAELAQQASELETVRSQLVNAKGRISALANEKAQLGDERAATQQYLDLQQRVSETAASIAAALDRCIAGQAHLIEALQEPELFDADDVQRFTAELDELCAQAVAYNELLQEEITQ